MSAQATFWAQKQRPRGGASAKLVLLALADIHNDHEGQNDCRPKVATLADRCMLSERQVRRVLACLERDGLIARKARYAKRGGYQVANGYSLMISSEKPCAPSPDISVRAGKPSPDISVRAMARTSASAQEPDIDKPSPRRSHAKPSVAGWMPGGPSAEERVAQQRRARQVKELLAAAGRTKSHGGR